MALFTLTSSHKFIDTTLSMLQFYSNTQKYALEAKLQFLKFLKYIRTYMYIFTCNTSFL